MADVTTYVVLGMVILPTIYRQAQRLVSSVRARPQNDAHQPARPRFLSTARLTPFATPFASAVSITALLLILISLRNLIPVQYGFDIFVPSSTVHGLRKWADKLYSAPAQPTSSEDAQAAFHIQAFRGGYKPDLFLAYDAPITIPTTMLRTLINDTPSLLPIGFRTQAQLSELQALISRLSSYEGRKMYLLLGPKPLLDCTFCKTTNDYFWFAVPFLLGTYAWRVLALGLLTSHPDDSVAVAIRQTASLFGFSSHAPSQTQFSQMKLRQHEADRSSWRASSLTVLLALLALELLAMFEFAQIASDSSRLNHWNTNLHILRQLVFLVLVMVVYLFPAPRVVDGFQQSMRHLDATQSSLQKLMHVTDLADVSRTVVMDDPQLLNISREYRKDSRERTGAAMGPATASQVVQAARQQGGQAADDAITQVQDGIRRITRSWWQSTRRVNQQIDQHSQPS